MGEYEADTLDRCWGIVGDEDSVRGWADGGYKGELGLSAQSFDLVFAFGGKSSVLTGFPVDQF